MIRKLAAGAAVTLALALVPVLSVPAPAAGTTCHRDVKVTHGGSATTHTGGWEQVQVIVACAVAIRADAYFGPYISAYRTGAWKASGYSGVSESNTNAPTTGGYDTKGTTGNIRYHCTFGC